MNELFLIFGLILLNGVFSMAEISLISARKSSLSIDAKKGSVSAKIALKLRENPDVFLSTVQIGITLIGILTGLYSGNKIASALAGWFCDLGVDNGYALEVSKTIIVIVVTYLTLVFGELLPKRIGMSNAEGVAKVVARPMKYLSSLTAPFVWILSKSTSLLFMILGLKSKSGKVTEDEIISIVNEGLEDGEVQEVEQDIVERVFFVGDLKVDSIMTHRRELVTLDESMTATDVRAVIEKGLYELYPVVRGNLDNTLGVVSLKSLVLSLDNPNFSLEEIIEDVKYFYCGMSVYDVLNVMKRDSVSRGLVYDEFGLCVGIVTLRDIMMALVGTVNDGERHEQDIVKRKDKEEWIVDGQCSIYDFLTYFDCEELFENEDYTTVAGLCLEHLHHIPEVGEQFRWNSFVFEISDMDGVRIDKFIVSRNIDT